jgi:Putative zinc-finger
MRCRRAERWMTMALAGELSDRRSQRLTEHMEGCAGCRREWEAYTALERVLGSLPLETVLPPRLEQVTLRNARLAEAEATKTRRRWLGIAVPALAATAVVVVAARLSLQDTEPVPAPAPAAPTRVLTAPPSRAPGRVAERAPAPAPSASPAAPQRRRVARGVPSQPPPELAARPDLFVNLPLLRNLDKVQHYEAIQTIAVDGAQSSG